MKKTVFADTAFWIALIRQNDQFHSITIRWQEWAKHNQIQILSTDAVLWEFLNASSSLQFRGLAAESFQHCLNDPLIKILPFKNRNFKEAFRTYRSLTDKEWSLTDCHSFQVMNQHGLTDALTTDHHFQQAGFRALLLEEPPSP